MRGYLEQMLNGMEEIKEVFIKKGFKGYTLGSSSTQDGW